MSPGPQRPRYEVIPGNEVLADVAALAAYGQEVVAAATSTIDDLAHGRVVGKNLGQRHVSGNLTGFARVKFDVPGTRPPRFRLVYRQVDQGNREIVAIGSRDEHAIYSVAVRRLAGGGS
ncbi:MAG: type II toxin-antitoxin system RelE/ParE family toxin [Actinomycetota bacterium]|nr:type II toxin-antitoxin system RelE/ParE family toxin [Actinomycetota bacterium]